MALAFSNATTFHLELGLQGTWKCKGAESGMLFPDVDFEDDEWTDYDETVSVFSLLESSALI